MVDRVIEKIARQEPHEFDRNPRERWRVYLETLISILDAAQEPASISRFVKVCDALSIGFAVASKDPADELLDVRSWMQFGFCVLCKTPKTADWSIIDRDDTAITGEEKQELLRHLYPLLRNMLAWANKFPEPKEPPKFPDHDLRGEIIRLVRMRDVNYWESAMSRKMFDTDRTTGTSNLNASFFQCFLYELRDVESEIEKQPLPKLTVDEIKRRVLWELEMANVVRAQRRFAKTKDGELSSAIRDEREKWQVEDFDFDGITAAVKDALSDNPSGRGLTMKMYDDLRLIVSHDWMASVSIAADDCFFEEMDKRSIFTPEEHRKYCSLIDVLKQGFRNRARKAETPEAAQNWKSAAEMVSSSLMRESLREAEWEFLFSLISCGRATQTPIPIRFLTKGTPEYKRLQKDLAGLIAQFAAIHPGRPCYPKEYLDFLVAMRDGTLEQGEMLRLLTLKNHGLVLTQADAATAFEIVRLNVHLYIQQIKFLVKWFEEAGRKGGRDQLRRYELIQPMRLGCGLHMFNPAVSETVIFRNVFPLAHNREFGYLGELEKTRRLIEDAWAEFFDAIIVVASGTTAFVEARNAYYPLQDQLRAQMGDCDYPYKPKEERQRLFETFKEKLNALAIAVFKKDSEKNLLDPTDEPTAKQSSWYVSAAQKEDGLMATENVSVSLVPAPPKPTKPTAEKKLKVGSWAKKFLTVDFETRTITFKHDKEPIKGKSEPLQISETAQKAWEILVELLTASNDTKGYVAINDTNRPWQTVLKQFVPKGRKEGIVDIYAPMTILRYHIHSEKKRGEPGHGRIRLQPKINVDLFQNEERRYKQWKDNHIE